MSQSAFIASRGGSFSGDSEEISEDAGKFYSDSGVIDSNNLRLANLGGDNLRRGSLAREMGLAGEKVTSEVLASKLPMESENQKFDPQGNTTLFKRDPVKDHDSNLGAGGKRLSSRDLGCLNIQTKGLRPALATQILRSEVDNSGHVFYIVWVMDVKSSTEWVLRKRFSEFFQFREVLLAFRTSIGALEFPPKRFSGHGDDSSIIDERLCLLQKFLRKVCGLICVNSLHPSTKNVHMAIQNFLDVPSKVDTITSTEHNQMLENAGANSFLQIYAHSVMQMAVAERIFDSFLDPFLADASSLRRHFTSDSAKEVLYDLRDFMNYLHGLLYEGLAADLGEIFDAVVTRNRAAWEASEVYSIKIIKNREITCRGDGKRRKHSTDSGTSVARGCSDEGVSTHEEQHESTSQSPSTLSEDDQRTLFRQVLRRQVEIEVYVACSKYVSRCMQEAFSEWENDLQRRMLALQALPQTFLAFLSR